MRHPNVETRKIPAVTAEEILRDMRHYVAGNKPSYQLPHMGTVRTAFESLSMTIPEFSTAATEMFGELNDKPAQIAIELFIGILEMEA